MLNEHEVQEQTEIEVVQKRVYRSPVLTEWGDIQDLTLGSLSGLEDLPLAGGSIPQR